MNNSSTREKSLGYLAKVVAGGQYSDIDAKPGQKLKLEGESRNNHDANATRFENERFEKIGCLPQRRVSSLTLLAWRDEIEELADRCLQRGDR